jgi:putative flavoprotein involved in K+ transport
VHGNGYVVETDRGSWRCRSVVLASGACNIASVPAVAQALPDSIEQFTPLDYRNPDQLEQGGVLIVGASATGTQLAHELHASGRPVTLAAGEHIRVPRVYRGRDIQWWMDVTGVMDERYDQVDDLNRARNVPSLQLAGWRDRRMVDLNSLSQIGVTLTGRLAGISDGKAQFSGSLRNHCAMSDLKMNRLLNTIDGWAKEKGLDGQVAAPHRFEPTQVEDSPPLGIDLGRGEIKTVLWATGYRPDYSWLDVPVLDRKGRIRHDGGIVEAPGMYVMGLPFLRRRKSTLIDGAAADARELSDHLAAYLAHKKPHIRGSLQRSTRLALA